MQRVCHSAMKRSVMKNPICYYTIIYGFFDRLHRPQNDSFKAIVADQD
jgi:hypothetical protein